MKNMTFIATIGVGAIVALGVYLILSAATVSVIVPKEDIEPRTELTSDMFVVKTVNKAALPEDVLQEDDLDDLEGRTAKAFIPAGQAVTESSLYSSDDNSALTTEGEDGVVVTLPADNVTGVSPELSAYDRVNIYGTVDSGNGGMVTALIAQNVEVKDVQTDDSGTVTGVTVVTDPETAEALIYTANSGGVIHFAVVPTDYQEVSDTGMTSQTFYSAYVNNTTPAASDPTEGVDDETKAEGTEETEE